jgi:hypothetical protein
VKSGPAGFRPPPPPWARLDDLSRYGICLLAFVLFGISGGLLWMVGWNYDGISGGAATKIHPGTYLTVLLFGWSLIVAGRPVQRLVHLANRRPAGILLVTVSGTILAATILRSGPGMAGLLDTYLALGLAVLLLADADDQLLAWLEKIIHVMMTANAVLAIAEFVLQKQLFPYRFEGMAFEWDPRSTALHGHPLANAMITGCYLMALLSGARSLTFWQRLPMIGLQAVALIVFGGRSAAAASLLLGLAYGGLMLLGSLKAGRLHLLGAAVGALAIAVVPAIVAALDHLGFFDILIARFFSDGGSAEARREMFDLLAMFPVGDLLVGPDTDLVDSQRRIQGLEWGIENPVIRLLLYQGFFITLALLGCFLIQMRELSKITEPGLWLPMIMWLVLLNGAESIASKTTLTTKFLLLAVALYRPMPREPAPATERPDPAPARRPRPEPAWRRPSYPFHRTGSRRPS